MAELRKYGVQATFYFPLIDRGQADFEATPVTHVANDTYVDKDGAGFIATTNAFAHRGHGIYSIVLTAAEMQAANIVITIKDQGAKAWEDQAILIDTYGNASAAHAFDLDTASQVVASVTGAVGSVTGAVGSVTGDVGGDVLGGVVGAVGSVTGAVGSVTGAVGSVTGDVGGDVLGGVVGAVGSVTGAVGSVTGAVGSVTGAVGSVTGDVGGNVTGSVGSVVGAVGSVTGAVGSVTGDVGGNVVGTVASVVGAVGSVAGNVGGNVVGSTASVVGAVGSVAGNVDGNLGGNVVGTLGGMTVAALAQFFTENSLQTYLTSVDGSVVKEIANAFVGTGANIFTLTIEDGGLAPIPGATAWISTDAAGATMIRGPLTSDVAGEIIFLLDDGTYYFWKQMAGYTFTNPESVAVNALSLTHTSTGTAVGTAALTQWSVNTLSAHLLGFFNQSRTAAGGTTPDRVKNEVRNSLRYVWDVEDWRHEQAIDTLTLDIDGTTITLPQDYRKAGITVLTDVDDGVELPITDSLTKWQRMDDRYEATDTGRPVLAAIIYDPTKDCDWLMKITPKSDAAYSFEFPYYKRCPVDLVAGHADLTGDADSIPMPTAFHQLWLLHAWWQIQEHFGKEVAPAKRAQDAYDKSHKAAVNEQNETLSEPTHPSARGYPDGRLFDSGGGGGRSDDDRMFYDVL